MLPQCHWLTSGRRIESRLSQTYETVREEEGPYIKLFNLRAKAHCSNVYGRMSKSVLPYLLAIHSVLRPVYMLVVDEKDGGSGSWWDAGGDTSKVEAWARQLGAEASQLQILTSVLPRAKATAQAVAAAAGCSAPSERAQLSPLGRVEGLLESKHIERQDEEISFSEAFGETVVNLVARLEPIVLEVEASTQPILIVAHEAAVRALRAYLLPPSATPRQQNSLPNITEREKVDVTFSVTTAKLLEFEPKASGGMEEKVHAL